MLLLGMLGRSVKIAGTVRLTSAHTTGTAVGAGQFYSHDSVPLKLMIFLGSLSFLVPSRFLQTFFSNCKRFADLCAAFFPLLPAVERQVMVGGFRPGFPVLALWAHVLPMADFGMAGGRWCSPRFGVLLRKEVLGDIPTNSVLSLSQPMIVH